ncbi:MAG: FAD-dependent oxidoreductase [Gemmatimonadaceae bacterium]
MSIDNERDRELGLDQPITRRDFLNGVAVGVGALGTLSNSDLLRAGILDPMSALAAEDYPPAKTGLRGSHDGAFENAHRLRDGLAPPEWKNPKDSGERYDLVIVGGGISGLSAAYFWRQRHGDGARILILDNHDDFGGHAKRNEFTVDGRMLIGYGGTQSFDHPALYSPVAKKLLREVGIDFTAFTKLYDRRYFSSRKLGEGVFFNREAFGVDRLISRDESNMAPFLARAPLAPAARKDIGRLYSEKIDYLAGKSMDEKKRILARTSYKDFLLNYAHVTPEALPYFQRFSHDYFGVGIDAVPTADVEKFGYPGTAGLGITGPPGPGLGRTAMLQSVEAPYIYHFPDGQASLTRLLVRSLIPGTVPGSTMFDVVGAHVAYDRLDSPDNKIRIRLSATAVNARNVRGGVDVTYLNGNSAIRVQANHCIMACWNGIIPHVVPEISQAQKEALKYGVKVPIVYANVALRNWRALEKLGVYTVSSPGSYWDHATLDFPVSMGAYKYAQSSSEPIVLAMHRAPCKPGLPAREQQRAGRAELLGTAYATYERQIRDQLLRTLGAGGFDPARDIAAITVNRWSHGYAYEYNSLWDPIWKTGQAPNELGRRTVGRIAIANSDAAAFAYTDAAIDMGARAVAELGRVAAVANGA